MTSILLTLRKAPPFADIFLSFPEAKNCGPLTRNGQSQK
jgi:hypothetical protein